MWGGAYFYSPQRPYHKVAVPLCSPILGVPSTVKFDMVTHMGRGLVFRGSATPPPQGAGSQHSTVVGVPFYLCVHPLLQNYQM